MTDAENQKAQAAISLRKSIAIYIGFLAGFIALWRLAAVTSWFPGVLVLVAYLVFGFLLNRKVLRGLIEWHPMYNTLDNVTSSKLRLFIFWPLSYAMLFFQLTVSKVL